MGYVLDVAYRHGQPVTHLRTDADVDAFVDLLLDPDLDPRYRAATAYAVDERTDTEGLKHELLIGVNPATGRGAVRYTGDEGTWYIAGGDVDPVGAVVFPYFGVPAEFPADAEVPVDLVRRALRGLLAGCGARPEADGLVWVETD